MMTFILRREEIQERIQCYVLNETLEMIIIICGALVMKDFLCH